MNAAAASTEDQDLEASDDTSPPNVFVNHHSSTRSNDNPCVQEKPTGSEYDAPSAPSVAPKVLRRYEQLRPQRSFAGTGK